MRSQHTQAHRVALRRTAIALAVVFGLGLPGGADASNSTDILCTGAEPGEIEPLPSLVDKWVVVLCTPTGQALGPLVEKGAVLWVNKRNEKPFLARAYPLNRPLPDSLTSRDIRFKKFPAREMEG